MRAMAIVKPSDAVHKANAMPTDTGLPLDQSPCVGQICIASIETASFLRMDHRRADCRVIDL
jgi:hypothetical protein